MPRRSFRQTSRWISPTVRRDEDLAIYLKRLRYVCQVHVKINKSLNGRVLPTLDSDKKFLAFAQDPCNLHPMALPRGQAIRRPPQGILRDPLCVSGAFPTLRIHHRNRNT